MTAREKLLQRRRRTRRAPFQRGPARRTSLRRATPPDATSAHSPAPPSPAPANPPPRLAFLTPDLTNRLFSAYLNTDESPAAIAGQLNINLGDFIAWHDHPDTRQTLDDLERIARERAARKAALAAPAAIDALAFVAQQSHIKPEPARKAANALLKQAALPRATEAPPPELRHSAPPKPCPARATEAPSSGLRCPAPSTTPAHEAPKPFPPPTGPPNEKARHSTEVERQASWGSS